MNMAQSNHKLRLLLIRQALIQKSDENHPLSLSDLIQLCYDHGLSAERKAIYDDLRALRESGLDILLTRQPKTGYFLADAPFETAELRLLIDAVQAASFISVKKTQQLIAKLSSLTNDYAAKKLLRTIAYPKNKASNENIFYTIDALQEAIDGHHPVSFLYFDMTVERQKQYRRSRFRYTLIPYAMIWENQRYYCIGMDQKHRGFSHYRIDKMDQLTLSTEVVEKQPFDCNEYISRIFRMYSGEAESVTLKVNRSLANAIFDQFGQEVLISEVTADSFLVHLTLSIAPPFLSWLFQFGNQIQVISPASLKETLKKTAQEVLQLYASEEKGS